MFDHYTNVFNKKNTLLFLLFTMLQNSAFAANKNLEGIIDFVPSAEPPVKGDLLIRGSTRLEPIISAWVKSFTTHYSTVNTDISFSGSGSAPKSLIDGSANIGAMSRPIKKKEIKAFYDAKGYEPTEVRVALDGLAVYVNRKNPLNEITLQQLDAIYSTDRKCGGEKDISNWEDMAWEGGDDIDIYDFNPDAGAHGYFGKKVLCKGTFKPNLLNENSTSPAIIQAVANSPSAIGYAAIGAGGYDTKMLAVSESTNYPFYKPTTENIQSGKYFLTRYLYIYIDKPPNEPMPLLLNEFFKFAFSKEGQKIVQNTGALALPPKIIGIELSKFSQNIL